MKRKRQQMILELIENNIWLTQEDLQNALCKAGFNVTQSTVSRDIRELKLVKGRDEKGNYRYLVNRSSKDTPAEGQYESMFSGAVKSVDFALNNVVVKCYAGMASAAGVAVDAMFHEKMLGSLAGDDTIFIVTRSEREAEELTESLKKLI